MPPIHILLTLVWLSTSFLITIASPMMIPVDVGTNEPARITLILENRQAFGRRTSPTPPPASEDPAEPIQVPIELCIAHQGTDYEHWMLIIDSTNGFHAQIPRLGNVGYLKAARFPFKLRTNQIVTGLGKAKFRTQDDMDDVFAKLGKIRMPQKAHELGGNCMDYIHMALDMLVEKGHILKVPSNFEMIYSKSYRKVRKLTWGEE
ncbi:hypothetical protein BDP27DRAFT_1372785 [Rhodocollybia butyracea]|uniref:Uncharacterized protein n=1 Tax=Rhodocollybia butyracea TaxID=206335 RepID=A0A9P5P7U9_9AGAR|nr:hypothetical protein BDP27DRAFT_1372785 [Rhodocollybia butyracea]